MEMGLECIVFELNNQVSIVIAIEIVIENNK